MGDLMLGEQIMLGIDHIHDRHVAMFGNNLVPLPGEIVSDCLLVSRDVFALFGKEVDQEKPLRLASVIGVVS